MENYITAILSIFALVISFMAYRNSEQKLRLDLFEARWEIYEGILKFCSIVAENGGIPKANGTDQDKKIIDGLNSAYKSFRGQGYHRSKALFGDDVNNLTQELSDIYSELYAKSVSVGAAEEYNIEKVKRLLQICTALPEIFKPYVYFGDIKVKDLN